MAELLYWSKRRTIIGHAGLTLTIKTYQGAKKSGSNLTKNFGAIKSR